MEEVVIVGGARTPFCEWQGGKRGDGQPGGLLKDYSALKLGEIAIKGALEKTNTSPNDVDHVVMGYALQTCDQAIFGARHAGLGAGIPQEVPMLTLSRICGSGVQSIVTGAQMIMLGEAETVVAGGMENMSAVPHYLGNGRNGQKLGDMKLIDGLVKDGLTDVYSKVHMGNCAEMLAAERNFTRQLQDDYAIDSYNKSISAIKNKIFSTEIVPVEVNQRRGNSIFVVDDEEPSRVNFDKIKKLRPAFSSDGTITAANASKLNDGAAVLLIMSKQKANECGLKPLGSILGHASSAHDPEWFTTAPSKVIKKLLNKVSLDSNDIDLWEINEAFSVVSMAAIEDFSINKDKVNIYGGAVALGHPIGASGARILTTLLNGMERTDSQVGLATLCIGGGEASALIIEKND